MVKGNPQLSKTQNILTTIYFFFYGVTYLLFYNTIINMADVLATYFDYHLEFMSTFPLMYCWFCFLMSSIMAYLSNKLKIFPYNILAHFSFIFYIFLFLITPFALVYIKNPAVCFWTAIVLSAIPGVPSAFNSSVFMGVSGMFSSIHNAIYFVGIAAGGLIAWCLRALSNVIFAGNTTADIFLTFYLNGFIAIISYIMYIVMFMGVPLTNQLYTSSNSSEESAKLVNGDEEEENVKQEKVPFTQTLKKMFVNLFSIAFIFFVTLSMFPGLFTAVSYDETNLAQQTTILLLTMCYMIGDLLSRLCVYIPIQWNQWVMFTLSVSRVLFYIPVFLYYFGIYSEPILMLVIMFIFSFTNGYISACSINLAYSTISPVEMKVGGNLVMVAMNGGLSLGSTILFLLNTFISPASK